MELKTGDILNCKGHSLLSKSIMKATNSKFSHTAIFIEVWGQPYVIDAQKNGVNLRPYHKWLAKYNYEIEVRRSNLPIDEVAFSKRALSKAGLTAYDFESLLLRQPFKLITGSWRNKGDKENDKMYCSEFAAWCHNVIEAYKMSPQDFYEWQLYRKFKKI